jgi:hypothetical protein
MHLYIRSALVLLVNASRDSEGNNPLRQTVQKSTTLDLYDCISILSDSLYCNDLYRRLMRSFISFAILKILSLLRTFITVTIKNMLIVLSDPFRDGFRALPLAIEE